MAHNKKDNVRGVGDHDNIPPNTITQGGRRITDAVEHFKRKVSARVRDVVSPGPFMKMGRDAARNKKKRRKVPGR